MLKCQYTRRDFLKATGGAALAGLGLSSSVSLGNKHAITGAKPNIIFIFADDLSYRDLSSYGQKRFETPHLDRLAHNALRFTQAYTGACECAPARAGLMTGMHMGHCRIRANRSVRGQDCLQPEDLTVAEVLKKAGYVNGFIGKWGIGLPETAGTPDKKGFDFSYGFYDQRRAHTYYPDYLMKNGKREILPENHGFDMRRLYAYNRLPVDKLGDVKNQYDENGKLIPAGLADPQKAKNSEVEFQKAALKFIRENRHNRFFLYYATQIPHGPLITPELGPYKDKPWNLKNKEWAAMIHHLDQGVGKMVTLLEELNLAKNTVIFFAGDNGYSQWGYFGRKRWIDDPLFKNKGPWRGGKFVCMEGGVRVPFFVYWPDRIQPRASDHICALYDFLNTAADLAGVVPDQPNDGLSLIAEMENRPQDQKKHEFLYWEKNHEQAVRIGPWRAYRPHPAQPTQLFRLDRDIACQNDIAVQHHEVVKKIEKIFKNARTDSEWYVNPGENKAAIQAKEKRARDTNTLQISIPPNSTYKRK